MELLLLTLTLSYQQLNQIQRELEMNQVSWLTKRFSSSVSTTPLRQMLTPLLENKKENGFTNIIGKITSRNKY